MNLNSIFFPAPKCTYNVDNMRGKLILIPKLESYTIRKDQNIINQCKLQIKLNPQNMTLQPKDDHIVPYFDNSFSDFYQITEENIDSNEYDEFYDYDVKTSPRQITNYKTRLQKKLIYNQKNTYNQQQNIDEYQDDLSEQLDLNQLYSPRTIQDYYSKSIQNNFVNIRLSTQDVDEFDYKLTDNNLNVNNIRQNFVKLNSTQLINKNIVNTLSDDLNNIQKNKYQNIDFIPCILLHAGRPSQYILIFFHGNGEDISHSLELNEYMRSNFEIHIMIVEYPGYGLYKGTPNEKQIFQDAQYVINFIKCELGFLEKNIIIVGRSIGCGPATYLASQHKIACLTLISPFTSIKGLVKDLAGTFISYLVNERFQNIQHIKNVKCPTFILHGKKDKLIPYQHSVQLHQECGGICQLNIPLNMSHTGFDFVDDLIIPLNQFMKDNNINIDQIDINAIYQFPEEIFENKDQ